MRAIKHTYHIAKGRLGEVSKISEEYYEFLDAHSQCHARHEIIELADLIGAIFHYTWNKYKLVSIFLYFFYLIRGPFKKLQRRLNGLS